MNSSQVDLEDIFKTGHSDIQKYGEYTCIKVMGTDYGTYRQEVLENCKDPSGDCKDAKNVGEAASAESAEDEAIIKETKEANAAEESEGVGNNADDITEDAAPDTPDLNTEYNGGGSTDTETASEMEGEGEEMPPERAPEESVSDDPPIQAEKRKKIDDGKILALKKAGWSNTKIADDMGISITTVANHLKKMLRN